MAMLPFCGYNMGDYFGHWLEMGSRLKKPPRVFRVNWFRTDERGKLLWPGYGENLRVLKWIIERCDGRGDAVETPIGLVPTLNGIDRTGIDIPEATMATFLKVDPAWRRLPVEDLAKWMILQLSRGGKIFTAAQSKEMCVR